MNSQERCYEIAYKALTDEPEPGLLLVHGTIVQIHARIGHAWLILPDGRVYDPVLNRCFSGREYVGRFEAIPECTYTLEQAAQAALHHRHLGPWAENCDTKAG